jgi:Domain of unknown function (DUF4386)
MDTETRAPDGGRPASKPVGETASPGRIADNSQRAYARFAGFMYLFDFAFAVAGVVITSTITGNGSFLDTAHRIAASETLYRIGIVCGLVGNMSTILLAIGLYVTVKRVDENLAITALLFRVAESTIGGIVAVFGFVTLQIYLAANHANAFDTNQLGALADLSSRTSMFPSGVAIVVSVIFFCVGSAIFFSLFLRSAYIPRILAAWGVFASLLFLIAAVGSLIVPQSSGLLLGIGSLPIGIAEVSTGLWLLMRGIKIQPRN